MSPLFTLVATALFAVLGAMTFGWLDAPRLPVYRGFRHLLIKFRWRRQLP